MRVVFFGTPDWAVPSLETIAASQDSTVALVVTQPSTRRGRGSGSSGSPVAKAAARLGLPVLEPASLRKPPFAPRVQEESADCFIVVAYGRIFPRDLLSVPRFGAVNVHFSLLPRHRGAAPVQWSIAEGDVVSGVTVMKMIEQLDAGPVYLQKEVPIEENEHAPSLGARLSRIGAELLVETLRGLERGTMSTREQDPSRVTFARLLTPEDGKIDWSWSALEIVRRIRGFDPWPGQVARGAKGKIKIIEGRVSVATPGSGASPVHEPGTILGEGEGESLRIVCGESSVLEAALLQPEGRRVLSGAEALRGRHVRVGERLERAP